MMVSFFQVDDENLLRIEPLGFDRRHNRYWRFVPFKESAAYVKDFGRVFVEDARDGSWRLLHTPDQLQGLRAALDPRGIREMELAAELERIKETLKKAMPSPPLQLPSMLNKPKVDKDISAGSHSLQAERFIPPGVCTGLELAVAGSNDARLTDLKLKLLQLETALPPSAVMAGAMER